MENVNSETAALPEVAEENKTAETSDTTPEISVPIKFNKAVKNLDLNKAGELAQKGLKFEAIAEDYGNLKRIAANDGKSVSEFLSALEKNHTEKRKKELLKECGGNEKIADYVMSLEKSPEKDIGFEELKKEFPNIKSISELPESVVENSKLRGTLLLDEYLRYRHRQKRSAGEVSAQNTLSQNTSIGPQTDRCGGTNPETAEFLKGLWK